MALHRTALAAFLIAAFCAPAALAQNAPITNTPNLILPPDALPDLAVTKTDAILACVGGSKITATIVFTMVNMGKQVADMSAVSNAVEARWHGAGADKFDGPIQAINPSLAIGKLAPGQSYSNTLVIYGIPEYKKSWPKKGQFYKFEVWADPLKQLSESNEKNNAKGETEMDPCPK